jgi:hydroxypyruvate reductase
MIPRSVAESSHRSAICSVLQAAMDSVEPTGAVKRNVTLDNNALRVGSARYDLASVDRLCVVGAGKAAGPMALALNEILQERICCGLVVSKHGLSDQSMDTGQVEIVTAAHPVPDAAGVAAASRLAQLAGEMGERDMVLTVISGGASALLPLPATGLVLEDLQLTTELLLSSGATILELNTVRKHLSAIKGGQLARMISPGRTVGLILSDVVGDPLDAIGSGPTAPDPTSFSDAVAILRRYNLGTQVPVAVRTHLFRGSSGKIADTPGTKDPVFNLVQNTIVASNRHAAEAAAQTARKHGLNAQVITTTLEGEAREAGKKAARLAKELAEHGRPIPRPACLVLGGETTVTVRGKGKGGRNQELALAAAMGLEGLEDVLLVALATDGEDGPTEAAGGVAVSQTISLARAKGMDPVRFLENNDSYSFFHALDDLIQMGPTLTNVADLVLIFAF